MTDNVQFSINGIEELLAKIKSVKEDVRYKSGRFALRKAANLVRDAARANARLIDDPLTPFEIPRNIAVRWSGKSFKQSGDLKFRVGILGGARKYANTKSNVRKGRAGEQYQTGGSIIGNQPGGDTYYWRFLEFGTSKMPARPFFQRALSENVNQATDEFVKQYGRGIDRAIKRAKR